MSRLLHHICNGASSSSQNINLSIVVLSQEGRNAQRFAASLPRDARIRVPKVEWRATTRRVLTMEYVPSLKLTDTAALRASELDGRVLAQRVVDTFLLQLLDTGILHCDPHPGNMCVNPDDGSIIFYDFGMLDEIAPRVRRGMRRAATALFGGSSAPSARELADAGAQLVDAFVEMG